MIVDVELADFLHRLDCPQSLALIDAVMADREVIGIDRMPTGMWIDWDAVDGGYLSSTERAAMFLARGVSVLERHGGGLPERLSGVARAAIEATA